jgi:serine/threonine protein kinase
MNVQPSTTTTPSQERSSSNNTVAAPNSDKNIYHEMMNELIALSDTSGYHRWKLATREESQTTKSKPRATPINLQYFFERESQSIPHHTSVASSDDDIDSDNDEFYNDDCNTEPETTNEEDDQDTVSSIVKKENRDHAKSLHTPINTKSYSKNRLTMIDTKQKDLLSVSVHTSDGTEVTATETECSLNASSCHSNAGSNYYQSLYSPRQSQQRYRLSLNTLSFKKSPMVFNYSNKSKNLNGTVPEVESLRIISLLGEGFFGKVYQVGTESTNAKGEPYSTTSEYYALKKISKYHLLCEDQTHTVFREKEVLQLCSNHPNIVTLYTTYQDVSYLYLLQSFVPGGELFTLIHEYDRRENCLHDTVQHGKVHPILSNESNVQFYVACIVDALWYLHCGSVASSKQSIVYRDLKPENIMINERGYPILIDFGYAKILEQGHLLEVDDCSYQNKCISSLTKTYTMCGTAKYLSPEMIEGIGHTRITDYWSLGIVAYELLTYGEQAFEFYKEMDDISLYRSIVEAEYLPLPNETSMDGMDFIDQLLKKDPNVRLGNSESVDHNPILSHPWLRQWDISSLREQSYLAPWLPSILPNKNKVDQTDQDIGSDSCDTTRQIDPNLTMREQALFSNF